MTEQDVVVLVIRRVGLGFKVVGGAATALLILSLFADFLGPLAPLEDAMFRGGLNLFMGAVGVVLPLVLLRRETVARVRASPGVSR